MLSPHFKILKPFLHWLLNHIDSFVGPPGMISAPALTLPPHGSSRHSPDTPCITIPPWHILFPLPAMLSLISQTVWILEPICVLWTLLSYSRAIWIELNWVELNWNWTELNWTELNWIELKDTQLVLNCPGKNTSGVRSIVEYKQRKKQAIVVFTARKVSWPETSGP